MAFDTAAAYALPGDSDRAALAGRVFRPDVEGPSVVALRGSELVDISAVVPTMRDLCEAPAPAALCRDAAGEPLGTLAGILANTPRATRDPSKPWLLAPIDLQAIKAAGVTFAVSMLERVIEEQARGAPEQGGRDPRRDAGRDRRRSRQAEAGVRAGDGPEEAPHREAALVAISRGRHRPRRRKSSPRPRRWPPSATSPKSASIRCRRWNNPEPEIVLVVAANGTIVGATLGNDVNLRDVEGRSALLLGKAKDNNASAAVGPFVRLFDRDFSLDDVRQAEIRLTVEGPEGYRLEGVSAMQKISRDPTELVAATIGKYHQYPDGVVLYLGTMFAPVEDRDVKGQGFTHKVGDIVTIASPKLGRLANVVVRADEAEAWSFGTAALMRNLAKRRLI